MMTTILLTIILCLVFWGCCYLSTGGDEKNIKAYATYPDEVQAYVGNSQELKEQIQNANLLVSPNPVRTFFANAVLFLVVLFLLGIFIRTDSFAVNLLRLSVMGQGLNLFDYLVIDLLWWRNTKRIRFKGTEYNPKIYRNPADSILGNVKGKKNLCNFLNSEKTVRRSWFYFMAVVYSIKQRSRLLESWQKIRMSNRSATRFFNNYCQILTIKQAWLK